MAKRNNPIDAEVIAHNKRVMRQAIDLATAAEMVSASAKTLRRRIADGTLPAYRVGPRAIRVFPDDVAKLMSPLGPDAA